MTRRIFTPYESTSTGWEIVRGLDLTGRRILVTGGASGIGRETSRALARCGAEVTIATRNLGQAREVAARIAAETNNPWVRAMPVDLTDLASVATLVDAWDGPLHVLVNNAGVMALPHRDMSALGFEHQFMANFLGHFALANGLRSSLSQEGGRIASVGSSAHLFSPVVFDDINFDFRPYDPRLAYAQSKTAVALFAMGAHQRWSRDAVFSNTLNPGATATSLHRHVGNGFGTSSERRKSVEQGASTSVLLAAHPGLDGVSGRYFSDNQEAETVTSRPPDAGQMSNVVAAYAVDSRNADRLWGVAERAVARASV